MTRKCAFVLLAMTVAGLLACSSGGDDPAVLAESQRVEADAARFDACFGRAVALDRGRALIGACYDPVAGHRAGAVFAFAWNGSQWTLQQTIRAYNAAADHDFGTSVALDSSYAVVGAPGAAGGWGATYPLFRDTEWRVRESRPMGGFADPSLRSGWSVAIDGRMVMVGTPRAPGMGGSPQEVGLIEFHRLTLAGNVENSSPWTWASDPQADAELGYAVAIDSGKAVAGAPGIGAVYAYEGDDDPDNWVEVQKIAPAGATPQEGFGMAVALQGDLLAVGSLLERSVHLYGWTGTQWTRLQTLRAWDEMEDSYFGLAVALDGDRLVVGAPAHSDPLRRCGAVYVYRNRNGAWTGERKLVPSTVQEDAAFGSSVAVYGDTVLVGCLGENTAVDEAGAAYFFDLTTPVR